MDTIVEIIGGVIELIVDLLFEVIDLGFLKKRKKKKRKDKSSC